MVLLQYNIVRTVNMIRFLYFKLLEQKCVIFLKNKMKKKASLLLHCKNYLLHME